MADHRDDFEAHETGAAMEGVTGDVEGPRVQDICSRFLPGAQLEITPLRGSGFSGARVSLVRAADRERHTTFVCKAFADGVDESRARWIHRLMRGLREAGVTEVPGVAATATGDTVVADRGGGLWELVEFRVGASTDAPTQGQSQAALEALARLHVAAARLPGPGPAAGLPPCLQRRILMAERMLSRPWASLRRLTDQRASRPGSRLAEKVGPRLDAATRVFAAAGPRLLRWVADLEPPVLGLQPVIRDVWADHVLFTAGGETVGGIIDYHAATIDSPATDLARLLGSWRPPGTMRPYFAAWGATLAAYYRIRPLGGMERQLVPVLAATGVLFGLDNWFRWLLEEDRRFLRQDLVLRRIDRLLDDLPAALDFLADLVGNRGLTG